MAVKCCLNSTIKMENENDVQNILPLYSCALHHSDKAVKMFSSTYFIAFCVTRREDDFEEGQYYEMKKRNGHKSDVIVFFSLTCYMMKEFWTARVDEKLSCD